jgi:hypothetical protein
MAAVGLCGGASGPWSVAVVPEEIVGGGGSMLLLCSWFLEDGAGGAPCSFACATQQASRVRVRSTKPVVRLSPPEDTSPELVDTIRRVYGFDLGRGRELRRQNPMARALEAATPSPGAGASPGSGGREPAGAGARAASSGGSASL